MATGLLGGLDDLTQPGMGGSQYVANPNFTASLAPPQMVANPRPGYGNWQPGAQAPPPQAASTAPTGGMNLTNADVSQALGHLYSSLGPGVDWVKYTGGAHGLLGDAANAPQGSSPLTNAFQGFQQYQDTARQIQQAKALYDNPDGGYHGREGGGIV
jgi:hypothetical protein